MHRVLVGRDGPLKRLAELLDEVEEGRSASVVVSGDPGSGKSALMAELAAVATVRGFRVLSATGMEFEADLGFAALETLFRSVVSPRRARPASMRAAFDEVLELFTDVSSEQPVVAIVDDGQWVDRESVRALLFAARRLYRERVLLVFACRSGQGGLLARAGFEELVLEELDEDDTVALLTTNGVTVEVGRQCWRRIGGNPLALLEANRALTDAQRRGSAPLPAALPVADRLTEFLAGELGQLSERTRRALVVAALETSGDAPLIVAAAASLGATADDLAAGEEHGVITMADGHLHWRHPLLPAAVLQGAPSELVRAAHRAVVEADFGTLDPDRVVWHLARCTVGSDELVAQQLEACGHRAGRRGAPVAAARAFEKSARLTENRAEALRRLVLAAEQWLTVGEPVPVIDALEPVIDRVDDPALAAQMARLLGEAELWERGPMAAVRRYERHAIAVARHEPVRAVDMLIRASSAYFVALDPDAALGAAQRAVDLARACNPLLAHGAESIHALLAIAVGRGDDAVAITATIANEARLALPLGIPEAADFALSCAQTQVVIDEWSAALELLDDVATALPQARLQPDRYRRTVRADVLWRLGQWRESLDEATLALVVGESTDPPGALAFALGTIARVEAGLGRRDDCLAHATDALEAAGRRQIANAIAFARAALGLLALGEGRYDAAADEFDRVAYECRRLRQPGCLWWQGDAIDALVGVGDLAGAAAVLDRLTEEAAVCGGRWAGLTSIRGEVLLGRRDPEEGLAIALDGYRALPAPFEVARTLLARSRFRLGGGDAGGAQEDRTAAAAAFSRLGAVAWRQQAEGTDGGHEGSAALDQLTPAERRVAVAVAAGATNREVADQLFLSVKTVDSHLQVIYRKLGVQRRGQLARLLSPTSH